MTAQYIEGLPLLPEHMRAGMRRWIEHGAASRPGSFLSAVIRNDLMDAVARADDINRRALPAYAQYLYCFAPPGSYGSEKAFEQWQGVTAEQESA